MSFCTKCGLCCRVLARAAGLPTRENGWCKFLAEDGNTCTIYEQRPLQCRSAPHRPESMDEESWDRFNRAACDRLQENFPGK